VPHCSSGTTIFIAKYLEGKGIRAFEYGLIIIFLQLFAAITGRRRELCPAEKFSMKLYEIRRCRLRGGVPYRNLASSLWAGFMC
jgi:hypothetical protein